MNKSLDFIYKQQKELSTFSGIGALLGWDQMTYMPKDGAKERAEQTSLISRLSHEKVISDEFYNHIKNLTKENNLKNLEITNKIVVERLEKDIEKARKIPSDFVEKMAKTTTFAYQAWEEARMRNKFSHFSPHLKKVIELEKEYCGFINLPGHLYNNLLDDYEEGMTVDKLKNEFQFLKKELKSIIQKIVNSSKYQNQKSFNIKISTEEQEKLCSVVIEKLNIPRNRFRLDTSTHPFTTSMGNDDVRITTSYTRQNPLFSFFSTIHEAGHALYELGLPKGKYENTVISDSPSLGLHESQSRFWENNIARSYNFCKIIFPIFQKTVPNQLKGINLDLWYKYINAVKPSLIRVEADELTYCLHVILRFELELLLIDDEIKVKELPIIWNEKMDELLGVTPKDDMEGVLQDMHWSGGSFGYFPTYAIGSIYASQIYNKLQKSMKTFFVDIEEGRFSNILSWLRENIHSKGRLFTSDEIIKNCCGEGLNSEIFVKYLKEKYYQIY